MRGIVEIFREIPDPRTGNATRHKLEEVLTIAILAILSECAQFTEMELFGLEKADWLQTFLELPHGIPSHDTFGDIFAMLEPKAVQRSFMEWVETIREKISGEVVAIDGKTICGSKDVTKNKRAIHVVSAWASQNGLVLGELATSEKSGDYAITSEKSHGRFEQRECYVTTDLSWLIGREEWKNLAGIGMILSERQKIGSDTVEKAANYVIYSKASMTAMDILLAKRQHWGIENNLHWTLDVIFNEDDSRMRLGNSAENMSVFHHLAINLINSEKTSKGSLNLKRKRCMLSQDYLLKVVGCS